MHSYSILFYRFGVLLVKVAIGLSKDMLDCLLLLFLYIILCVVYFVLYTVDCVTLFQTSIHEILFHLTQKRKLALIVIRLFHLFQHSTNEALLNHYNTYIHLNSNKILNHKQNIYTIKNKTKEK